MMPYEQVTTHLRTKARAMRRGMTDAERSIWYLVRAHRLDGLGFRRQFPIGGFIVDFACPSARLVLEIDGAIHDDPEARERDRLRALALAGDGWKLLRFTNKQALTDLNAVKAAILQAALRKDGDTGGKR